MNRLALIAVACATACSAAPAEAAVFLSFSVTATGTRNEYTVVPGGSPTPQGAVCVPNGNNTLFCNNATPLTRTFNFAQEFELTNGVLLYQSGTVATGRTMFTLTDAGGGNYALTAFNYYSDTRNPAPGPGVTEALIAPGQIIRATAAIPEPATWAMLLFGFGAVGAAARSVRRTRTTVAYSC